MVELTCRRRFHAYLVPGIVLEEPCRFCSTPTMQVYHRWDVQTGEQLDDRVEGRAA